MTNWSTRVQHEGRRPGEGSNGGQVSEGAHVPRLSGRLDTSALNWDAGAKTRGVKSGPEGGQRCQACKQAASVPESRGWGCACIWKHKPNVYCAGC